MTALYSANCLFDCLINWLVCRMEWENQGSWGNTSLREHVPEGVKSARDHWGFGDWNRRKWWYRKENYFNRVINLSYQTPLLSCWSVIWVIRPLALVLICNLSHPTPLLSSSSVNWVIRPLALVLICNLSHHSLALVLICNLSHPISFLSSSSVIWVIRLPGPRPHL